MAVLTNGWTSMDVIVARLTETLKSRYGVAKVLSFAVPVAVAADEAVLEEAARSADFALVGLAN